MFLHQTYRTFTHFGGILPGFVHGFILSRIKASSKPGVVHIGLRPRLVDQRLNMLLGMFQLLM
ncbi:hypothetical protein F0726_02496 [Acidithiobacillus caldus]|nr:hypothetical protein F0726_02496 [Acidithiobacillus caldus]